MGTQTDVGLELPQCPERADVGPQLPQCPEHADVGLQLPEGPWARRLTWDSNSHRALSTHADVGLQLPEFFACPDGVSCW